MGLRRQMAPAVLALCIACDGGGNEEESCDDLQRQRLHVGRHRPGRLRRRRQGPPRVDALLADGRDVLRPTAIPSSSTGTTTRSGWSRTTARSPRSMGTDFVGDGPDDLRTSRARGAAGTDGEPQPPDRPDLPAGRHAAVRLVAHPQAPHLGPRRPATCSSSLRRRRGLRGRRLRRRDDGAAQPAGDVAIDSQRQHVHRRQRNQSDPQASRREHTIVHRRRHGTQGLRGDGGAAARREPQLPEPAPTPSRAAASRSRATTLHLHRRHREPPHPRDRPHDRHHRRRSRAPATPGFAGDGGAATEAELNFPRDLELGADGTLYVADTTTT